MKISIIVPSFNQPDFIEYTFQNLEALKEALNSIGIYLEILLFDSCSVKEVQCSLKKYRRLFDYMEIRKDNGQYDAINKGMLQLTGDYWTWLNTDDLININGCIKIISILEKKPDIDYIYGNTMIIDEKGNSIKEYIANKISINSLINKSTTIVQPGSFFKTSFSKKIGLLEAYHCCFDYEYILRLLSNKGNAYRINEIVSHFRYYSTSKSGALESKFINEQLKISHQYKRKFISKLTFQLYFGKIKLLIKSLRITRSLVSIKKC